ncbi:MAG: hypothetical protein HY741_25310 [Chloroflexi bacterium]|nr:hypothetical protein [Chloroflexota bacterium]
MFIAPFPIRLFHLAVGGAQIFGVVLCDELEKRIRREKEKHLLTFSEQVFCFETTV